MTERELQAAIIDLAHSFGWFVAAFRPAQTQRGNWVTPVQGDGAGWPDLVLVHPGEGTILYRELKVGKGKLDPRQEVWQGRLFNAGGDVGVWRDTDWPRAILVELSHGRARAAL